MDPVYVVASLPSGISAETQGIFAPFAGLQWVLVVTPPPRLHTLRICALGELHFFLPCNPERKRSEASTGDWLASACDGISLGVFQGLGCDRQERLRDRGGTGSFYPGTHPFGRKTAAQ